MPRPWAPAEQRFWENVDKTATCWNWKASYRSNGYGQFMGLAAHRYSWILHFGPVPGNMWVLHKCDNRQCVNPEHLFLGTAKDNFKDMRLKNRWIHGTSKGEKNGLAKLNWESVNAIRRDYVKGNREFSYKALAKKYGVHKTNIMHVIKNRTWISVNDPLPAGGVPSDVAVSR